MSTSLEIHIRERTAAGYPVELRVGDVQVFSGGYLTPAVLPWIRDLPANESKRLTEWFFSDDRLKIAWAEVRGQHRQRRVRLRVDASAPELHTLPGRSCGMAMLDSSWPPPPTHLLALPGRRVEPCGQY